MEIIPPQSVPALLAAVDHLWSLPSSFAETGVHHGYRQTVVVSAGHLEVPEFADLVDHFTPTWMAWLSSLAPGGFIAEHIDRGPYFERWQVPLSDAGALFHDGTLVPHRVGVPFRVRHFDWHHVVNDGPAERVSLVVDRRVPLDVVNAPFQLRGATPCPS